MKARPCAQYVGMQHSRRFVLVGSDLQNAAVPIKPKANFLQPIAWGQPDPVLARSLAADVRDATPRFQFNGVRAALRSIFD